MQRTNTNFVQDGESEEDIISRCDYLSQIGLWPNKRHMDYFAWLKNFNEAERKYALNLLSKFQYVNDELCNEIFKESFVKAGQMNSIYDSHYELDDQWEDFYKNCIVCPVRGERPSMADSGYSYVQKARNIFGIEEDQFKEVEEALKIRYNSWISNEKNRPIIFIDDFIGSGNQFYTMWNKVYNLFNLEDHSHHTLSLKDRASNIYYCCLIGTEKGVNRLEKDCHNVKLCVGHIIKETDSIFHRQSTVWQGAEQQNGLNAVKIAGDRCIIPDTNGKDVDDWKGYKEQGLLLGIREGSPDATIGAVRWNKNGWQPLIKKR